MHSMLYASDAMETHGVARHAKDPVPWATRLSHGGGHVRNENVVGVAVEVLADPVVTPSYGPSRTQGCFPRYREVVAVIVAWFAILFTGRYPRGVFGFVEAVFRWHNRVIAYAFTLVTGTRPSG